MSILITILHIIVCLALILIVLLQTGKGANMGALFGGGSSGSLFGTGGTTTFLSKATTIAAVVFMVTSLVLTYFSGIKKEVSVIEKVAVEQTQDIKKPTASESPNVQSTDLNDTK